LRPPANLDAACSPWPGEEQAPPPWPRVAAREPNNCAVSLPLAPLHRHHSRQPATRPLTRRWRHLGVDRGGVRVLVGPLLALGWSSCFAPWVGSRPRQTSMSWRRSTCAPPKRSSWSTPPCRARSWPTAQREIRQLPFQGRSQADHRGIVSIPVVLGD